MNEQKGIKELMDIVHALNILAETAVKVTADGEVNVADAKHLLELMNEYKAIIEAINGAQDVLSEIKDIDEQEAIQIGLAVFNTVKTIIKAVKQA